MTETQAPAGWYPDPAGDATKLRYWDGAQWSEQLKEASEAVPAPASTPTQPTQTPVQSAPDQTPAPAPVPTQPTQTPVQPAPDQAPASNVVSAPMDTTNSYDQYGNQPMYQQMPMQAPIKAKDNSNLAIASLVLSIIGLFVPFLMPLLGYACGILAIVFGVKSRKGSRKTMATIGIVIGIVALIVTVGVHAFNTIYLMGTYY